MPVASPASAVAAADEVAEQVVVERGVEVAHEHPQLAARCGSRQRAHGLLPDGDVAVQRRDGMDGLHPDRRRAGDAQRRLRHRHAEALRPCGVGQRVAREEPAALRAGARVEHAVREQAARARRVDPRRLVGRQLLEADEVRAAAPRQRHERLGIAVAVAQVGGQHREGRPARLRGAGAVEGARGHRDDQRDRRDERDDRDGPLMQEQRGDDGDPGGRRDVRRERDGGDEQRARVEAEDAHDRPDEPGEGQRDGDRGPHRRPA